MKMTKCVVNLIPLKPLFAWDLIKVQCRKANARLSVLLRRPVNIFLMRRMHVICLQILLVENKHIQLKIPKVTHVGRLIQKYVHKPIQFLQLAVV